MAYSGVSAPTTSQVNARPPARPNAVARCFVCLHRAPDAGVFVPRVPAEPLRQVSRHKLTRSDAVDYRGDSLFSQFAQVVCELDGVVPRKELHESWEAARLIHAAFPSVMHVADLASGNGLLSWALMVMDNSQRRSVLCVDKVQPPSFVRIANAMISRWPTMRHRHRYVVADIEHPHLKPQARAHARTRKCVRGRTHALCPPMLHPALCPPTLHRVKRRESACALTG